jgi:CheY-like chemotaxis protein
VPDRAQLKVLVVDDDVALARLLSGLLVRQGWSPPVCVATGAEALALAADQDLILLDYHLPDATGLDLLPAIRARSARPAVVVITAHGSESLAAGALRAGADDYLIKDASLAELLPQVLERVRRHRALREALAAAERDLVHAERLNAIGEMNVTLHHAVNNPLMAALAELELLAGDGGLTPEQREGVAAVRAALQRIREIVERARTLKHARTAEYAGGVQMIDLSRRTQPMPVDRGRAMLALPEEDTARVVGSLLRHAGFRVERVAGGEALTTACQDPEVTLIVIAGTDGGAGSDPLGGFSPCPGSERGATVVAFVAGDGAAARAAGADHVVTLPFDPGTFTSDLLAAMLH